MYQHARSKHRYVLQRDDQIPNEVSSRKTLNKAISASITEDPALPIQLASLIIREQDPQCQDIDQRALHERYDVNVPVQFRPRIERGVYPREEITREGRRDVLVRDVVQGEGEYHLVEVERKRFEGQVIGYLLDIWDQTLWRSKREWVEHSGQTRVLVGWWLDVREEDGSARCGVEVAQPFRELGG